jgi:hypothetical protein
MPLSPADIQKVQLHLQASGVRPDCHACGGNNWIIGEELVAIPGMSPDGAPVTGGAMVPLVPMVQVICRGCGYIMHFAARTAGLIP